MPQVHSAGAGERNQETARLNEFVCDAFIPRCPYASGMHLSACHFLAGTFQEHKRFHRTKKGCEIVNKPNEAVSAAMVRKKKAFRKTFVFTKDRDK